MNKYPFLGPLSVSDIELYQILETLEPIWYTQYEAASRLRARIESVLDWAIVMGFRSGPNPARWEGHLDMLLGRSVKISSQIAAWPPYMDLHQEVD